MSNSKSRAFTHAVSSIQSVQQKAKLCEELKFFNIDDDIPGMVTGNIVPYHHSHRWESGPWHFFINLNYHTGDLVAFKPGNFYIDLDLDNTHRPMNKKELDEVEIPYDDEHPHYFNENNDFLEPLCRFSFDFMRKRGFIKGRWYIKRLGEQKTIFQYNDSSDRPVEKYNIRYASPSEITGELLRRGEIDLEKHIYDFYENRIIKP